MACEPASKLGQRPGELAGGRAGGGQGGASRGARPLRLIQGSKGKLPKLCFLFFVVWLFCYFFSKRLTASDFHVEKSLLTSV